MGSILLNLSIAKHDFLQVSREAQLPSMHRANWFLKINVAIHVKTEIAVLEHFRTLA